MVNPFIVKNAATAAAGAAKGAARIALSDKGAKAFASATKSIESSYESGALQSVESIFTNIKNSGPVLSLLEYITKQVVAGTMDGTLALFNQGMDFLASPEGKATMTEFIGFLKSFLGLIKEISAVLILIEDNTGGISAFFAGMSGFFEGGLGGIFESIAESSSTLAENAQVFIDAWNAIMDRIAELWPDYTDNLSSNLANAGGGLG